MSKALLIVWFWMIAFGLLNVDNALGRQTNFIVELDALDQVISLTNSANQTWNWNFDGAGRQSSQTNPNNTSAGPSFDNADQLIQLKHLTGANVLAQFDYVLNPVGNREKITRSGLVSPVAVINNYGNDLLDRLTGVSSTNPAENEAFSFGPVGNQTQNRQIHNAANQLIEDTNFIYKFDDNGNLLEKRSKSSPND